MAGVTDHFEWIEISDPDGEHRGLFQASKSVYSHLFSTQHREKWSNFRGYISDTQQRLAKSAATEPRDYYFVGTVHGEVRGMAFLTAYPSHHLAFIAYLGVLDPGSVSGRVLSNAGINSIRAQLAASEPPIEAILIEVEKIPPQRLSRRDRWTQERLTFLRNIQRVGARKITWLVYEQMYRDNFDLDTMPRITDLHLMVIRTSYLARRMRPTPIEALPRATAERYLKFLYEIYCLDGFKISDPERAGEARRKLQALSRRVLSRLPQGLREIPLGEVALTPLAIAAFVSHTRDGVDLTELLGEYLMDMGARVKYWEKDAPRKVGEDLHRAVKGFIKETDVVIALITDGKRRSDGMIEELIYARDLKKRLVILMSRDMATQSYKSLEQRLMSLLGRNIIYIPFTRKTFHIAVHNAGARVREWAGPGT